MGKMNASFIGPDLSIRGDLMTSGEVEVKGEVVGDIRARVVTVGMHAEIYGEIVAKSIIVEGKVTGRLRGRAIQLTRTAQIMGEIWHKTLGVEGGAFVQGRCRHMDEPHEARAEGADMPTSLVLTTPSIEVPAPRSVPTPSPEIDIPIAAAGK